MVSDPTGNRRRIASALIEEGRTPGDRLADRLGMTLDQFWPLVNCPWFEIEADGWDLTDRGRKEAFSPPAD